jgi:hypothetical protein
MNKQISKLKNLTSLELNLETVGDINEQITDSSVKSIA